MMPCGQVMDVAPSECDHQLFPGAMYVAAQALRAFRTGEVLQSTLYSAWQALD